MIPRPLVPLLPFLLLSACAGGPSGDDDTGDDDDDDWNLAVENESASTMELLRQRPCPSEDEDDWNEIPLPPSGIGPGDSHRTLLPSPGCFDLSAEGDGCFADGTTGPMEQGQRVTWTITDDALTCVGR